MSKYKINTIYNKLKEHEYSKEYEYSGIILNFFAGREQSLEDFYKIVNKDSIKPTIDMLISEGLIKNNDFIKLTGLGKKIHSLIR